MEREKILTREEYSKQVSLDHEINLCQIHLTKTKGEIQILEKEEENLRLESKWCFDKEGNRIIPSAEDQALKISEKLHSHPQLAQEVVKALRMKKLDLSSNLSNLQQQCDELEEILS